MRNTSHQVLWAALLQVIQLPVHICQVLVDAIQLCLQVFILLVVAVKITLVVIALLFVCDSRIFPELWKPLKRGMDQKEEVKIQADAGNQFFSSSYSTPYRSGSSRDERVDVLPTCQSHHRLARHRMSCSHRSHAFFWAFQTSWLCLSLCCRELHYAEAHSPPLVAFWAKNGDNYIKNC